MKNRKETLIFYEAPHRIEKTVKWMHDVLGNRDIVIARELTKLNEEYIRGTLDELVDLDFSTLKGEMVIIVSGNNQKQEIDEQAIKARLEYFHKKGLSNKDAIEVVADEYKINKNTIYKIAIEK